MLDQINGVLFTGGNLDLIGKNGEQHEYYKTAKRIYNYAKRVKNERKEDWPILGICQGQQLISMILSEDKNILE